MYMTRSWSPYNAEKLLAYVLARIKLSFEFSVTYGFGVTELVHLTDLSD